VSDRPPVSALGITRQAFLLSAALSAGAAAGPGVRAAFAQAGGGDTDILNFALTLELLEARFYEEGLQRVEGLRSEYRLVAVEIRDNESEHVRVLSRLIARLGSAPATEPQFDFGDAFSSEDRFLEVAQQLEDTGVAAYNGAIPRLSDRQILGAAAAIVNVEARHSTVIRLLREKPMSPGAFDRSLNQGAVVKRLDSYIGDPG
jgi:rubrerythrin